MKLFIKRFSLVIIGIFLSLIIIECGLRLAGWTIVSYQQYKNKKAVKNKSQYTIMCIGESTTAGQYPIQLQQILNERYPKKFSVIDCGIPATNLETILDLLDNNISKYNPDIAICMMGINNSNNFTEIEQNNDNYIKKRKLKLIKLFLLLKQYIKNINIDTVFAQQQNKTNLDELLDTAIKLQYKNKFEEAAVVFNEILKTENKNSDIYIKAYEQLTINYLIFSYNDEYKQKIGAQMAENAILNNFEINKDLFYQGLLIYFIKTKQTEKLENIKYLLLKDNVFIPKIDIYNLIKPFLNSTERKYLLNKILSRKENYHLLAIQYLKQKDFQKAKEYFDKTEQLRLQNPNLETYDLYKLIIKKLTDNNIKVICMQYPTRSIKPLQEQLKNEPYYNKITFISNEKIFKNALMQQKYEDLFIDQYGGDFGHCTDLGNTLIAENAVNTLEKILNLTVKNN